VVLLISNISSKHKQASSTGNWTATGPELSAQRPIDIFSEPIYMLYLYVILLYMLVNEVYANMS